MATAPRYVIAQAYSIEHLTEDVNRMLANGWRLVGGVSSAQEREGWIMYCQALTDRGKSA